MTRGPYTIVNCGTKNAAAISKSLDNLASYLKPAILDADKASTTPSPAFSTFFADRSSAIQVASVLTNVTTGPPLYPANSYSNGAPIFACLQESNQMSYTTASSDAIDAYDNCRKDPNLASYAIIGTAYIVICPSFFAPPPSNPSGFPVAVPASPSVSGASDCLTVNPSTNQFIGDGKQFTSFAPWLILEGIVHYYLSAASTLGATVYDANGCAGLSTAQSVANAHNYVYYAASELRSFGLYDLITKSSISRQVFMVNVSSFLQIHPLKDEEL